MYIIKKTFRGNITDVKRFLMKLDIVKAIIGI